jgi:hypothetical protein
MHQILRLLISILPFEEIFFWITFTLFTNSIWMQTRMKRLKKTGKHFL